MTTENDLRPNKPTFRTLDMNAEVRRLLGPEYDKPEVSYQFTGKKFELRTGDAAIYASSPDFG